VSEPVLVDVQDGVGVITLNRPDRRNALTLDMLSMIGTALADLEANPSVGAVVLTGAGGAFCGGGDVKAFAARGGAGAGDLSPADLITRQHRMERETVGRLSEFTKPTLAALPGAVAGAGLGLALACDLRVGSTATFLVAGFAAVGLPGDYGVAWLLTRLAGPARTRRFMLLGERLDLPAAREWGLVDRVADPGQETVTALALAAGLAAGPREALAAMKQNLLDAERLDLAGAMEREVPRHIHAGRSDEHRAALAAFTAKAAARTAQPR
jgi:2-(1,2-epoxy-1,2-dihydrophenyl)acetyl-CoA isomerase